jgi:drug/metabolite transporter (DMT)-like permease
LSRSDTLKRLYFRYRVVAAFLLVPLLWGINWSFMKIGILSIPPFLILGSRQLLAGLAHAGLARASGSRFPRGPAMVQAIVLGILLAGVSNGLMFWGVQYITSGLASILFGTMPFFVAFLSAPLLGERLTSARLIGVAVGFAGVALLLGGGAGALTEMAFWGQAALMLSAVTWALPLVLTRKWLSDVDTQALTAVEMLSGAAFLLPLGLATEGLGRVHLTVEGLVSLAYMSVFAGFVGFALYYWMVRQMSATRLALTSFITPGVAVITGIIVLSEPAEPSLFIGLALVATGIIIVNQWGERAAAPLTRQPAIMADAALSDHRL